MTEAPAGRESVDLQSKGYDKAKEALRKQCESLWNEMKQLQVQVADIQHHRQDSVASGDTPALDICLARQKWLTAQIAVLKATKPSKLPNDKLIQYECVGDEIEKSVSGLQDLLTLVRSTQKELAAEIKKEEQFKAEMEQVQAVLQEKLEKAIEKHQACNNSSLIEEMKQKETVLNKHCKMLMKTMGEFVKQHFPEPSKSQLDKWRKQHVSSNDSSFDDVEIIPLINILQILLNQCIDSPHNPYITLDDTFWPPYIELLIRTGIALRNPHNTQQIRLTPFYL